MSAEAKLAGTPSLSWRARSMPKSSIRRIYNAVKAVEAGGASVIPLHIGDPAEARAVGGLVVHQIGHLPKRGERIAIGNLLFKVLRADNRRVHMLQLTVLPRPVETQDEETSSQS